MFTQFTAFKKTVIRLGAGAAFAALALGTSLHGAQAMPSASVSNFYASCRNFSVEVTVNGSADEGQGQDRFRYEISDGAGHLLYQESAARPINIGVTNTAYNLPYQANAVPTQNPITFKVVHLDAAGNPAGLWRMVYYDASCLKASGQSTYSGIFPPPESFTIRAVAASPFYAKPGGIASDQSVQPGEFWPGVYRTADNQWVAVYANSNQLQWLPAAAVSGQYTLLPLAATRIEHLIVNGTPDGITMSPGDPSFLHAAPSLDAPVVATVNTDAILKVNGVSADHRWVRVEYQGKNAWIYYRLVCLMNGDSDQLPVVTG